MSNDDSSKDSLKSALSGSQLLHYFGNGLFFISVFFGLLYLTKGNEVISFLIATLLWGFNFICIEALKSAKTENKFRNLSKKEITILSIFMAAFFCSSILVIHFINTEFVLKSDIKAEGVNRINLMDDMKNSYVKHVDAMVKSRKADLEDKKTRFLNGNRNITDEEINFTNIIGNKSQMEVKVNTRIESILNNLKNKLNDGLDDIENRNLEIKKDKKAIFDNWNRFKLSDAFKQLDARNEENLTHYKSKSKEFSFSNKATVSFPFDSPSKLIKERHPNLLIPILVVLVLGFLIVIPYFFVSSEKSPLVETNFKTVKGYEDLF